MAQKLSNSAIPPVSESARESEITATYLLKNPKQIAAYLHAKRFAEVACLADYLRQDVPRDLAKTDPSLFRTLRRCVTDVLVAGWGKLDGNDLRRRAAAARAGTPPQKNPAKRSPQNTRRGGTAQIH